ncbi:hypothetical protein B0J12DRAFT_739227 [Macrophomina phaseolina]|uniref:gamma-glutamylcyclotransferase n=1 Tax=Macrophomina phaseolina TaxID=35725 RepID=A0ABQ8GDQ5_9PEZI|nr:hypothetical protein B0J12DRAFT_739227 [Macrophomina phaseolina]
MAACATIAPTPTLYFAYGSNLWLAQMAQRCPTSRYVGVARLRGRRWRWLINERGYANVVGEAASSGPSPPPDDTVPASNDPGPSAADGYANLVYGMLYALQPADEARLDVSEGVPEAYGKEWLEVDFWSAGQDGVVDVGRSVPERRTVLVYVDRKRVGESEPKEEYVHRMNEAVRDAVRVGVPAMWVREVVRRFIPEEE